MSLTFKEQNKDIKEQFYNIVNEEIPEDQKIVIDLFFDTEKHLSARDIKELITKNGHEVFSTSIESALDFLVRFSFAKKLWLDGEPEAVYEHLHLGGHHDHLICMRCGEIEQFYDEELEKLQTLNAKKSGFHSFHHKLEIYGLCSNCMKNVSEITALNKVPEGARVLVKEIKSELMSDSNCKETCSGKNNSGFFMKFFKRDKGKKCTVGADKRLQELGIIKGKELDVLANSRGPIILGIDESRVALGRSLCSRVLVEIQN